MAYSTERINTPVSNGELERRWAAVRAAMKERKIDALLMQNNNDHMGGYVKYFTDLPATFGYPVTVVFPREDRMSVISQGPIVETLGIMVTASLFYEQGRLSKADFESVQHVVRTYQTIDDAAANVLAREALVRALERDRNPPDRNSSAALP